MLVAAAWSVLGWLVYGLHLWLVAGDPAPYLVATGAYAFAWASGLLTFVVPAGVGVREGAIVLVLGPLVGVPQALVAAIVSRLAFTLADLALAGAAFAFGRTPAQAPSNVSA